MNQNHETTSVLRPEVAGHLISYSYASGLHDAARSERTVDEAFRLLTDFGSTPYAKGVRGSIIPAVFSGRRRCADDATRAGFIGLDIDGTAAISEAVARVKAAGVCACLYTTASHGATATEVKAAHLDQYRDYVGAATIEAAAEKYLHLERGYQIEAVYEGVKVEPVMVKGAPRYRVTHGPLDKFRIVFPLATAWRVEDFESIKAGKAAFADWCAATAHHVGIKSDRACRDIARLFFRPTFKDEAQKSARFAQIFDGDLLEPRALPPAPPDPVCWVPKSLASSSNCNVGADLPPEMIVTDRDGEVGDLVAWFKRSKTFRLVDALEDAGAADDERGRNGAQLHLTCPREYLHSPTAGGFFVAQDGGLWRATCSHNGCHGVHRIAFVAAWIEDGTLTWAMLNDAQYRPDDAENEFEVLPGWEDAADAPEGEKPTAAEDFKSTTAELVDLIKIGASADAACILSAGLVEALTKLLAEAPDEVERLGSWFKSKRPDGVGGTAGAWNAALKRAKTAQKSKAVAPLVAGMGALLLDQHSKMPVRGSSVNAILATKYLVGDSLRWNEFSDEPWFVTRPARLIADDGKFWKPRVVTADDESSIRNHAELKGVFSYQRDFDDAVRKLAKRHTWHPVKSYLEAHAWDGVPRLDEWLMKFCGADDTALNRAFGSRFLIASVRRVYEPGAKHDTMLILEGPQGLKKSTALAALAGPWFCDQFQDFHQKDDRMKLRGKLIVELPELDIFDKSEIKTIKSFLSTVVDEYRAPYDKRPEAHPRVAVFAGTINRDGNGFLRDTTGGRRFNCVECRAVTADGKIDLDGLTAVRDQLWAEAKVRADAGEPHWLWETALVEQQKASVEDRTDGDVWEPTVSEWLGVRRNDITASEILEHALKIPHDRMNRAAQMRVANVMTALGWRKARDAGRRRIWVRPEGWAEPVIDPNFMD